MTGSLKATLMAPVLLVGAAEAVVAKATVHHWQELLYYGLLQHKCCISGPL